MAVLGTPRKTIRSPGRCSQLAPAHPPGATQKVERSTTDRSTGVNLRHDHHIARRAPKGSAGDARFPAGRPVARTHCRSTSPTGCPAAVAAPTSMAGCPTSVTGVGARCDRSPDLRCSSAPHIGCPMTMPPRPLRSVARPPLPEFEARSSGCPAPSPLGVVHADPVARAVAVTPPTLALGSSWGAPSASSRCTSPPAASGCPATRCFEACGFSLRPEPLSPRGSGSFSAVVHPEASLDRLALSIPVGVRSPVRHTHSRTQNRRSRGISQSPGFSTKVFHNPQDFTDRPPAVHKFLHNLSPGGGRDRVAGDGRTRRRWFDERLISRLNGRRCDPTSPSSSFLRARDPHVLVLPPTGGFFVARATRKSPP